MLDDGGPRIGQLSTWIAIVVGALVLHLVGLVDDRRPIGAWPKLGVQVGLAALLVLFFDVRLLHLLDDFGAAGRLASVVCTVLWIVVITNAFNFLDNMDGLAGGVAQSDHVCMGQGSRILSGNGLIGIQ